ncbi:MULTISPECIES: hypothetical protein [Pseudomonas]|uniref:hypothetical protein n=1 Tax=Pseudomonas TaxID=286 RepID=UPI000F7AB674|nr:MULTISPECIES: hypothetical protein [Pseudomonas]RRV58030.1 hypothetical protein EGJ15_21990 [Pseudomonas sp. p99-361]
MASGLETYGSDGRLLVNMTMSISQHQGDVVTNAAGGAIALPAIPAGKRRFYIVVSLVDTQLWKGKKPGVTISGDTMSWQYQHSTWFGQFSANCRIYYGYY